MANWGYLNGYVGFGDHHHQIMDQLVGRAKLPEREGQQVSNYALVNADPSMSKHDVAWGHMFQGIPVFWNTNADRNAIADAVLTAHARLKEVKEHDPIHYGHIKLADPGGQLMELQPGDTLIDYDGQHKTLPEPSRYMTGLEGTTTSEPYGANVMLGDKIIGSVEVEVETFGDGTREVVLHNGWVDPKYRKTNTWLKLYRWVRSRWPHDRFVGDMANDDIKSFFNRENLRAMGNPHDIFNAHLGDTKAGMSLSHDGTLDVRPEDAERGGRSMGKLTRINLLPKGAWHPYEDALDAENVVSVEQRGDHRFGLNVHAHGPVSFGNYPSTYADEPELGNVVGHIAVNGAIKPVHDEIHLHPRVATERVGSVLANHAPWYETEEGRVVVGNWGRRHADIGGTAWDAHGWIDRDGIVHQSMGAPSENVLESLAMQFFPLRVETKILWETLDTAN